MSYEGFEQHICEKGHYFELDAWQVFAGVRISCHCGAKSAWMNTVDETNNEAVGLIPYKVLEEHFMTQGVTEQTCPTCGQTFRNRGTFRIPTEEEAAKLRTWRKLTDPPGVLRSLNDGQRD